MSLVIAFRVTRLLGGESGTRLRRKADAGQRLGKFAQQALGLRTVAERDAYAARAAGIAVAVAHQDAALPHLGHQGLAIAAKVGEHEIRLRGPEGNVALAVKLLQPAPAFEHLRDVAGDVLAVVERGLEAGERNAVYVVGRSDAAQHRQLTDRAEQRAEAEARQSVGFGKRPADEEIVNQADLIEQALAAKVNVGLVDQHRGLRRGLHNGEQLLARGDGAGGIVGTGDADEPRLRSDGAQQSCERETRGASPDCTVRTTEPVASA